jgi:hypothetical protein
LDAISKEKGQLQETVGSNVVERQRLEQDLAGEKAKALELAERLSKPETVVADQHRNLDQLHQQEVERRERRKFTIVAIVSAVLLGLASWGGGHGLHRWTTYSLLKSHLLSGGLCLAVWLTGLLLWGRPKAEIRSWPLFQTMDRGILWLRNTAWVLVLGLLTNLIWELAK